MNRAFLLMLAVVSLHTATAQNAKFEKWKTPSYFRGVNTTNINAKTQADFDFLKNTGANLVQIGTLGFQDVTPPYDYNPESAATTDSLVKFCRQSGLHYTIALRQGAGRRDVSWENSNGASTLWTNVEEQRLYASMVKSVTERYKGDSLFVGINAIMEPNPLYDGIYYAPELLQSALATAGIDMEALYAMFIDSVRAADTELPVIIQSVSYSSPEFFKLVPIVNDPYAVYEFHSYRPSEFVKAAKPNSQVYPGIYFSLPEIAFKMYDKKYFADVMFRQVTQVQQKTGAPVFLGEFGLMYEQTGGAELLKDVVDIALDNGWHFAYWEYRNGRDDWNIEKTGEAAWGAMRQSFKKVKESQTTYIAENLPANGALLISSAYIAPDGIHFSVSTFKNGFLNAELYNTAGDQLATLSDELTNDTVTLKFTNLNLATGIYFISVSDGFSKDVRKVVIIR